MDEFRLDRPRAREEGILAERVDGEVLVYDRERDRAHSLNPTAARIWELCDGTRGLPELAEAAQAELGEPVTAEVVELALERLARAHLLEGVPPRPKRREAREPGDTSGRPPETRRQHLRRLAKVGVALPVVMTVVAPTPAQAATLITPGDCFWNFRDNSGRCCTNGRRCVRWVGDYGLCLGSRC